MKHRIIPKDREARIRALSKDALTSTTLEGERLELGSEIAMCFNDANGGNKLWFGRVQAMLRSTHGGKGNIPVLHSLSLTDLPQSLVIRCSYYKEVVEETSPGVFEVTHYLYGKEHETEIDHGFYPFT